MATIWIKYLIITLVIAIAACKQGHMAYFRASPTLNLYSLVKKYERNNKLAMPLIQAMKLISENFLDYNINVTNIVNLLNIILDLILKIFNCDYLSCITPEVIIVRVFHWFRNLSREVITEMFYGYKELFALYLKKELCIITKIIEDKGIETFTQSSDCIRMRIGQYYMQTFVGGNTSECSEFDQIIQSFSEQQVDETRNFFYLGFLILAIIFLCFLNKLIFKLIVQEYGTYKGLKSFAKKNSSSSSARYNSNDSSSGVQVSLQLSGLFDSDPTIYNPDE
ncbi:unnamed protein product [Moneuplotes crassus]|uniref:Uncharacterized protein n=1 Tax=Euplotes crassus TaxID=5936 RepID=A0AAD1XAF5_EUPCR|nr:unnamed protein product [Moneuplotes crassus]